MKKKRLILFLVALFIGIGSYPFFPSSPDGENLLTPTPTSLSSAKNEKTNQTIVRTKNGFSPDKITIRTGQSITFISKDAQEFWPASDPHPNHTNYSGFDAGKAINPNGSWRFTFTKEGTWRFHDHLAPFFQGVVTVNAGNQLSEADLLQKEACLKKDVSERIGCWDNQIRATIQKKGLKNAFNLFAHLYATQPLFVSQGCHWVSHQIGQEAYRQFADGKNIELSEQTSYCGYGFYHGFMQLLLYKNQDIAAARNFCLRADEKLKSKAPLTRLNCFHGIGHGLVQDPPPPELWGNAQAMVDPLIPKCLKVSNDETEKKECTDGIFNAVILFKEAREYGLTLNRTDPLGWCRKQKKGIPQLSCYYESSQKLDSISGWSIQKAASFTKDITDDTHATTVIGVAAAAMIQRDILRADNTSYIYDCRKIEKRLQIACLRGITNGYISHGEPEKEYIKVLSFCKNPAMTRNEANLCYQTALGRLKNVYSVTKIKQVCLTVEERYKQYCG